MIIDFHMHGKITSKYPFDEEQFLLRIEEAKSEGMDSLALTEHSNAYNFIESYNFLNNNFEYIDNYYNVKGIKIFIGVEVTTIEKLDILFIGERKDIIDFNNKILQIKGKEEFISIDELYKQMNNEKFLIIWAHPYRKHKEFSIINKKIFEKIDAIEFNARDLYNNGIENMQKKIVDLSKEIKLPIVAGSDTHYFLQIGSIKNIFKVNCNTVKEIKEQIKLNNYSTQISKDLSIRVRSSKIIKNLIISK